MNFNIMNKNDEMIMALIHYFITEENYTPIVVKGTKDEVWLENLEGPYRIIRINSNHIHNEEQYKLDVLKTKSVVEQIKKKTLSLKIDMLNIMLDVAPNVEFMEDKVISSIKINDIDEMINDETILKIFPNMESKLLKDKVGIDLLVSVTNDINAKTAHENVIFSKIFDPKRPVITPILIGICVLVFILMYVIGYGSEDPRTLLLFGANLKELVKQGEVWRLATSIFLHIGIFHLVFNMYALWVIGRQLEGFIGKFKYLIVFLGSGILGSLLSVVVHSNISAGASGAIFGLLGSLLYFGYHYRLYLGTVLVTQIVPVIVINLLIGFLIPGIDIFAHIGGLVGGYLLTCILGVPNKENKRDRINASVVLTLLVVFLVYVLFRF